MQMLYRGCRDIIADYRPGWKFWTLRAAILVSVIQGFAFEVLFYAFFIISKILNIVFKSNQNKRF